MTDLVAPNLDGMDADFLWQVSRDVAGRPRVMAKEMFPDRPTGYVTAARSMGAYAANKATAMRCRASGDVQSALTYEGICERIYNALPEFARW